MSLVDDLAARLAAIGPDDLPLTTLEHAAMTVVSSLAAVALGQDTPPVTTIADLARRRGATPAARVWFTGSSLALADAVRVNTMAADESMADDSALVNGAHLGSAVTAAALAAAQVTGATGRRVLTAIVTGYEAAIRLAYADRQQRDRRHAHVSGLNAFASATAVGTLLGLSGPQLAQALAIAATGANGVDAVSTTPARPYQAGFSALVGVEAALAAQAGYEVGTGLLDRFLDSPVQPPETFGDSAWAIDNELIIKLRPGAFLFASAVDAALALAPPPVAEIERVEVRGHAFRVEDAARRPAPSGSLAYYVASALALGRFGWDHFTGDALTRPEVVDLVDRVTITPTSRADAPGRWGWAAQVTVTPRDGATRAATVDLPPGALPRGVGWDEVAGKAHALLAPRGIDADRLMAAARGLADGGPATTLIDLL